MAFQQWDPTSLPIRPGLYVNFVEAAAAQISGGTRGIVAIPLMNYGPNATAKTFYTVETEKEATDLFGADNIQSIKLALQGGAKEVLVYTMPSNPTDTDYIDMRNAFEARPFDVFVYDGEVSDTERMNTKTWVTTNRNEGKHFMFVTGGSEADDQDPTVGNARTAALDDDYIVNLIVGGTVNGVNYSSGEYAAYIAGLIAGTPINRSITYVQVPLDDVNKRLRNSEIRTALEAGSLVLVNDGEKVKVEQGLTTSGAKIRLVRARQAIMTDIAKTARDNYIGRLNNNPDGQAALISAIKAYLEELERNNVLMAPQVMLDPQNPSVGDAVFLVISYVEVDSMERIFLTINI
jgi:Phage tail sheath protein subtilisin-like domain/Phage tail sheath C-terminal domain